jgi:drug/metabolite transporter (DMT)-like permease
LANLVITLLSFAGVVLIVEPEFIFGANAATPVANLHFYVMLMIISAFSNALNMHFIHSLAKHIQPQVNMHYSHIGFLITSSLLCNFAPSRMQAS